MAKFHSVCPSPYGPYGLSLRFSTEVHGALSRERDPGARAPAEVPQP
ncbi:hypothetical protein RC1_0845 [Rhodospirillum centenum SW]|uniref:Uncharacterized protein n=1 Tax=Rhodospirillum centenum (strain ATCC 51521 / SW) TaxID=414684 RepID=B6IS39_RHOCS|nr:hypothetical protein RC1_0845 [Rhodospirillum centenum SW]